MVTRLDTKRILDFDKVSDTPSRPSARRGMRRLYRWIIYLCALLLFAGACLWVFLHVGEWLVVQDPLEQAHAIVVLSGRMPERAIEAARIYQGSFASQVWVSQPVSPAAQLAQMHIAFIGEDFYNQKVLMAEGVPADAIRIFEVPIANTQEEVDEIASDLRRDDAHAVIIVTSKVHTRRVRLIWDRRVGGDPKAIVRYVSDDPFDAAHWWRRTQDALDVVREVLGIANARAGFPLRPEPH
jgi:uncharacterized SAM-binding protein YcdF (DUF218 family)